ncbi:AlbA family DNA-binding domain-containing protein [Hymenobacter norwichensis]|uniref:AlbA family DNA-binding domain-containing protein n=1 Tax=Hymenobacter norwichensis TaxID=223903 RepID=UPI0003B69B5E|nr:ATP-binding protein [Hymenobacter norwichensis]
MSPFALESIIRRLIDSKREGEYWDFKVKHHENKADFLHDLICLANSLYQGNRYLIFGVDDPAKGANIIGLQPGESGRKSQANYIDFIRNQTFAGGYRPEIELINLVLDGKDIDVLVIFDNPFKPYLLTEDYLDKGRKIKAQYVYTRVGDSNTPQNQSAELFQVEKMWRQRLGLDMLPVERMKHLLGKPEEWFKDLGNKHYAYHENFPDYRIKFSEPKPFWEPYSYFFTNKKSFLGTATFKLNSTTLFELEYIYLDEMRLMVPGPNVDYVELPSRELRYYFYDASSAEGRFLLFLADGRPVLESRGTTSPFLVFKNGSDQQEFNEFLIANATLFEQAQPGWAAQHAVQAMQKEAKNTVINPLDIGKIAVVYKAWRQQASQG